MTSSPMSLSMIAVGGEDLDGEIVVAVE